MLLKALERNINKQNELFKRRKEDTTLRALSYDVTN